MDKHHGPDTSPVCLIWGGRKWPKFYCTRTSGSNTILLPLLFVRGILWSTQTTTAERHCISGAPWLNDESGTMKYRWEKLITSSLLSVNCLEKGITELISAVLSLSFLSVEILLHSRVTSLSAESVLKLEIQISTWVCSAWIGNKGVSYLQNTG